MTHFLECVNILSWNTTRDLAVLKSFKEIFDTVLAVAFKWFHVCFAAVVDTNGRYFGGRIVKASFYDHDKFKRLELSD